VPVPIFATGARVWEEIVADYNEEQLTLLLDFLTRSNAVYRSELARLQAGPEDQLFSAPLQGVERGRLVIFSGLSQLVLRAGERGDSLYQAHFEGITPQVAVQEGVVTIRYPRRLWMLSESSRAAEVVLSQTIPWQIAIQGGAAEIVAELSQLVLAGLEVKGGLSTIRLELPMPTETVPIRINGGASDVHIRRPAGVAARVHLKGWASFFVFDDQTFSGVGNNIRLQTPDYELHARRYDIDVASSVSSVTITSV
jgi:hypothetical protein